MLLLSNSPKCARGLSGPHLKDITADVTQSNQEVDLSRTRSESGADAAAGSWWAICKKI